VPAKPESKLWAKIRVAIAEYGGQDLYFFKMHGGPHSVPGVPDGIMCYRGWFVGMEVKMPGRERTLTEKQGNHLKSIRRAGGVADVVTSPEQAVALLQKIDRYISKGVKIGTKTKAAKKSPQGSVENLSRT
jgi:hypothetical protein